MFFTKCTQNAYRSLLDFACKIFKGIGSTAPSGMDEKTMR